MNLEQHFGAFRAGVVGADAVLDLPRGRQPLVYADWTASGRLYGPLEDHIRLVLGPLVANTHSESTTTGTAMTHAYQRARQIIKDHVGAGPGDSLLFTGFGMTAAVNKLQRLLGLRGEGRGGPRPVVFITHMEHHSNQITWEECDVDVVIVPRGDRGLPDLGALESLLVDHAGRPLIGAFTAASNVTGIVTPWGSLAAQMHRHGGVCFVDFAAAAPYVDIDMHPADPDQRLDAITFSPHKFLGGPGSSGVLVLANELYRLAVPDQPGGGTVKWTTPFGTHRYVDDIETREDGGTPGFLQAVRAALAVRVKEAMGTQAIHDRERELLNLLFDEWKDEPDICPLEADNRDRLGIVSFYSPGRHHNLLVRLLNDRFGVQTRGGCSCAGTYGHVLFRIGAPDSRRITDLIDSGDLSQKPGWVRVSVHPTMTDDEVRFVARAVVEVVRHYHEWAVDYAFDKVTGEFSATAGEAPVPDLLAGFEPVTSGRLPPS